MTRKTDLVIVAAGKGSRMKNSVPKALIEIAGVRNVDRTIALAKPHFENIYAVISKDAEWPEIKDAHLVPIESGKGDGHAMLKFLNAVDATERVCVVWGDAVFQDNSSFVQMIRDDSLIGCVGVRIEENPYVNIKTNGLKVTHAEFSKYGEISSSGNHDQSIFIFNTIVLKNALRTIHETTWKGDKYILEGGELSLLHTFHYLNNIGFPMQIVHMDKETLSYNTPGELEAIRVYFSKKV